MGDFVSIQQFPGGDEQGYQIGDDGKPVFGGIKKGGKFKPANNALSPELRSRISQMIANGEDPLGGAGEAGGGEAGGMPFTATTITDLPEWLKPFALNFINSYSDLVMPGGHLKPYPNSLDQTIAGLTPEQQQALGMFPGLTQRTESLSRAGARNIFDTVQGKYLDPTSNPWLRKTYEAAAEPVIASYKYSTAPSTMAAAQRAGQMGGSAYTELEALDRYNLGRNLDELATSIYGQNYSQERGRQIQAQQLLPGAISNLYQPANRMLGVGSFLQGQNQDVMDVNFANALRQEEYPFSLLSGLGAALGQAGGGTGTSTSTSTIPPGLLNAGGGSENGLIGSLLAGGIAPGALQGLGGLLQGGGGGGFDIGSLLGGLGGGGGFNPFNPFGGMFSK